MTAKVAFLLLLFIISLPSFSQPEQSNSAGPENAHTPSADSPQNIRKSAFKHIIISCNLLSFLNNEVSFLVRSGQFGKRLSLMLPIASGIAQPYFREYMVHSHNQTYYLHPTKKKLELGIGLNRCFEKSEIGEVFFGVYTKWMNYYASERLWYFIDSKQTSATFGGETRLYRYVLGGTLGWDYSVFSNIYMSFLLMTGFRYDAAPNRLMNPITLEETPDIKHLGVVVNFYYCFGIKF